jgi:hypothetical protein
MPRLALIGEAYTDKGVQRPLLGIAKVRNLSRSTAAALIFTQDLAVAGGAIFRPTGAPDSRRHWTNLFRVAVPTRCYDGALLRTSGGR